MCTCHFDIFKNGEHFGSTTEPIRELAELIDVHWERVEDDLDNPSYVLDDAGNRWTVENTIDPGCPEHTTGTVH